MLMRGITCFNVTGCLYAISVWLMLIFPTPPAIAADRAGDEFLTGYIASILERDLHWERDSYRLKVVRGVATITLFTDDPGRREAADKHLRTIDGLHTMTIVVVKPTDAGRPVGGVDMKSFEEHNWDIDNSIKVGLEFGHPNPGQRRLRLMAQWYKGYDPRGQFYNNKIESYGLGVSLGF